MLWFRSSAYNDNLSPDVNNIVVIKMPNPENKKKKSRQKSKKLYQDGKDPL